MAQSNLSSSDRAVRSLVALAEGASAARTLNLISAWKRHHREPDYLAAPFFVSPALNRSIVVKHRVRPHEREDLVANSRPSATKVILPLDPLDLRLGARSFFVGQKGYEQFMAEVAVDPESHAHDSRLLMVLDRLPSLDPFLMREKLRAEGFAPARSYFGLTESDTARMMAFVRRELAPLIGMSFGEASAAMEAKSSRLAEKLITNSGDAELEPLRQGLGMSKADFDEGVFCWKGFIYYKWTLGDLLPKVRPVTAEIAAIRPFDPMSKEEQVYILAARRGLSAAIAQACKTVRETLNVYEDAYGEMTKNGKPQLFRDFLLRAPSLFDELGERLGAIHHIISFWRYRFPAGAKQKISTEELTDLLAEFESSLAFGADATERGVAAPPPVLDARTRQQAG